MATKKEPWEGDPIWDVISQVLGVTRRALLFGPPGTGKTYCGCRYGLRKGQEIYNVTCTPDTPAAEWRGHFVPKGHEFIWQDGPAVTAWRNGGRLIVNEIDQASDDLRVFLHNLLDDPEFAKMTLPTGETITPHDGFQVVATTNHPPTHLHEALRDRFPVTIEVPKPNPEAINALPEDLRALAWSRCTGKNRIGLRKVMEFDALRKAIPAKIAAEAVFGDEGRGLLANLAVKGA